MEEIGSSHMKVERAMIKMVNNGYIVGTALANEYGCLLSTAVNLQDDMSRIYIKVHTHTHTPFL